MHETITNPKLILALLACSGVSSSARAYYLESRSNDESGEPIPVRYVAEEGAPLEVAYRLNLESLPDVEGVEDALHAAFATWTAVECSALAYVAGEPSDLRVNSHWRYDDGEIYVLVFFSDDPSEWTAGPSVGHFFWAHDGTGKLIGGTVVLNSKDHAWATDGDEEAMDVQSIATALIGRAMGITSNIEGNSTFGRYQPGTTDKRELGDDEVDGLRFLYADTSCDEAPPPMEMCDGTRRTGDDACPPRPSTSGGPGTRPPAGTDSGPPPMDAGPGGYDGALVDAGGPPERDVPGSGGGCSASGGASGAWWLLLLALRRRDPHG